MHTIKQRNNPSTQLKGGALLYAIAVLIIINAVALLLLTYFRFNTMALSRQKKESLALAYCYQGLGWLSNTDVSFDKPYQFSYDKGYQLKLIKKRWGVFELYNTMATFNNDTLKVKIAIAGYGKNTDDSTALFVGNSKTAMYATVGASITGICLAPLGLIRPYLNFDPAAMTTRIYKSPDSFVQLKNIAPALEWCSTVYETPGNTYTTEIPDSFTNSFANPPVILTADTVFVSGELSGNVVIKAKTILVNAKARLSDVILLGRYIYFAPGFSGQVQAIAADTLLVGRNANFSYPSVLALFADIASPQCPLPLLQLEDSCNIYGEVYAYSNQPTKAQFIKTNINPGSYITGGIYTTGILQWNGTCNGCVVCNKIKSPDMAQDNMIKQIAININALPSYYSFSSLYPFTKNKKIVKWCR